MADVQRSVPLPTGYTSWPKAKDWTPAWWAAWLTGKGWAKPASVAYLNARDRLSLRVTKGHGKSAQTTVLYAPGPRAVDFHDATCPNLLYGGAAGGMKSYSARWDIYMRMLRVPGSQYLLLRRTFTELTDNHLNDASKECDRMREAGVPIRYLKDDRRVVVERKGFDTSWLRFGHCQNEGDEEQYLSNAYEGAYLDEAATFTQTQAMAVQTRLRSVLVERPDFRCMSNPGGPQTLWLKRYFIDRTVTDEEHEDYQSDEWGFIFSQLYDNPYYMDPDGTWTKYARRLKGYGPERARQMLDGDWDAIAGQFFSEFRRDLHVQDLGQPSGVQWFRCMDWGYNQPGVCYWVACLPDGRLYVAHEYVFRQTLVSAVAVEIRRQTALMGSPHIRYTVADGHMFDMTGTGETMAETSARSGVTLLRADNSKGSRIQGWQRLRHWLALAPDGRPWLVIHPRCTYLIRSLPALVSDRVVPDDVDTHGDDHGGDAIRMGVMSRPSPTIQSDGDTPPPPNSWGWWRQWHDRQSRPTGILMR